MRVIGLDLGSKTIGVALSDSLGMIAHPLKTFYFRNNMLDDALEIVVNLVKENDVKTIVLGLPKNMDGSIGFQAQYCLDFKDMLEKELEIGVVMIDERLTSVMAERTMMSGDLDNRKRKKHVDKIAATIILQSYLDGAKKG
ncbi:MAG: Holliday junction resolvase RuvX [Bacilli bacterium]|jgi:putative Holliday junction resolvase|nr:Holliday junction resolvase RuvX [Bacilli bacterium]MDD2682232.1 Holliday junction resolvase RuvX [Bacilli bacterium]MDD3121439.1 Holliday junction resolvase RuvX [Bacilli bacterium]MDD4063298.1 Holliday junction resolvase RuvX [Bacilli bacterium]MDD4482180.1 Holliday junction resolvase RuvX [Bacilli bacterium]